MLEQNETLLPYSYNNDQLAVQTLPGCSADAAINTLNFVADYTITPVPKVNVRAFFRSYDLNNDTPSSNWQYVTQDTSNLNGTVSYVNKRVSLPYEWNRQQRRRRCHLAPAGADQPAGGLRTRVDGSRVSGGRHRREHLPGHVTHARHAVGDVRGARPVRRP